MIRRPNQTDVRHRSQAGSTLIMVLIFTSVLTIIIGALVGFANVNQRAVRAYRDLRTDRYAGDEAIKTAVNWVKDRNDVARDPSIFPSDPACVYTVPDTGTV